MMHHKQRYLRLVTLHFILHLVNRYRRFFAICSRPFRSSPFRNCRRRRLAKASSYLSFLTLLVEIHHMLQGDLAILAESYVVTLFAVAKSADQQSAKLANCFNIYIDRLLIGHPSSRISRPTSTNIVGNGIIDWACRR